MIDAKIISAGTLKALMPEDCLDVSNRTAIEKQGGCRRVPEDMRPHFFLDAGKLPVSIKISPKVATPQPVPAF